MTDNKINKPCVQTHTIVKGDKQVPLKEFGIWREIRDGMRRQWIENRFTAILGFDEALNLFFTKGFVDHFYDEIGKMPKSDYTSEWHVLRKIHEDFECGLHGKEFSVIGYGMTLIADSVTPVATFFPIRSTDLVIEGNFKY